MTQLFVELSEIIAEGSGSVNPASHVDECFELYSIPAFDAGEPEVKVGAEIGSSKQVVKPGDVLLSKIVPHIRRSWIVGPATGKRIIASGEWIVFRSERFDPRYLRHVLVGDPFHVQFMNTVAGVGGSLLRARPAHVAKIKIRLPPLSQQKRIAEILDRAEALRAKRRAALALLDELTQSIFLDMFGDLVSNPKRLPQVSLAEVTTRITDGTHLTPKFADSGVPFIFVKNVRNGSIDFQTDKFISEEQHALLYKRCPVEEGDVLYTTVGATYGQAASVGSFTKFAFQRHLAHLKPDRTKILPLFLGTTMQLPLLKQQADRWARGVAQPTINLKELREMVVPLPPIPLQQEFAERVTVVEAQKTAQRASLAELSQLFASLQHRAFRGEL